MLQAQVKSHKALAKEFTALEKRQPSASGPAIWPNSTCRP